MIESIQFLIQHLKSLQNSQYVSRPVQDEVTHVQNDPLRTYLVEPWDDLIQSKKTDLESVKSTYDQFLKNFELVSQNYKDLVRQLELERNQNEKWRRKWKILEELAKKLK